MTKVKRYHEKARDQRQFTLETPFYKYMGVF